MLPDSLFCYSEIMMIKMVTALAKELGLEYRDLRVISQAVHSTKFQLFPAPIVVRVSASLVRTGADHLTREIEVARYLAELGLPVVAPHPLAGPYMREGFSLSFWDYVPPGGAIELGEAFRGLLACHEALVDYSGPLAKQTALEEALAIYALIRDVLDQCERRCLEDYIAEIDGSSCSRSAQQPIHGDAHVGNVIFSPHGPLWNDFEDVHYGSPSWDIACFTRSGCYQPEEVANDPELDRQYAARRFQRRVWRTFNALPPELQRDLTASR
jgi:hypothetical protein